MAADGGSAAKGRNFVWHDHGMVLIILTAENIRDQFCFKDIAPNIETLWKLRREQCMDFSLQNAVSQIDLNELRDDQEELMGLKFASHRQLY